MLKREVKKKNTFDKRECFCLGYNLFMEKLPDREFGGILAALMVLNGCAAPAANGESLIASDGLDDCLSELLQAEGTLGFAESSLSQDVTEPCERLKELERILHYRLIRVTSSCVQHQTGIQRVMEAWTRHDTASGIIHARCRRAREKNLKIPKDALLASN